MIFSFLCTLLSLNFVLNFSEKDFINEKIKRTIDISQSIITIENEIKVKKNTNSDIYRYLVPKNNTSPLIRITANTKKIKKLDIKKISSELEYDIYEIQLQNSLEFTVHEDYFEKLEFKPKNIYIKEDQLELFTDFVNLLSAYSTKTQTTTVILPSENTRLLKYTTKNSNKSGNKIIYSLTDEIPPYKSKKLSIHYENNEPLVVMNYAKKSFQVSHWGNIAVKEEYQIENIGAKLIGEFGRIDYDEYGRKGGKNALKNLKTTLPLRAWGLWYRDEIGNISTSVAKREWNNVDLSLTPRFPILGGWKSNFDIGYNLPTKFHVLKDNKGNYLLNLTFGMPYKHMLAKNYTVKVTLDNPENLKVILPIDAKYEISYDKEYGFLDLFGRKTVIITLNNMYEAYNTNFYISYYYKRSVFFKLFILFFYFLVLFAIMIIYSRTNVSLSRSDEELKLKKD